MNPYNVMQYPEFLETLPEEQKDVEVVYEEKSIVDGDDDVEIIEEEYIPENEKDEYVSVSSYAGSELTPEEEMRKKKALLIQLRRLQKKGYTLSRHFTMESDLIDMQAEVESLKREANLGMVLKTMKKGLCVGTFLLEQLNNKYKPMGGAELDGWSNQVKNDVDDGSYDEIFEELYDKYCNKFSMPPELKLLTMLGTSAIQYHIAQSIISRTLNVHRTDEILRKNPGLKDQIIAAASKTQQHVQQTMDNPSELNDILEELDAADEKTNST